MNFNLDTATVYLVVAGSHSYGLSTPESDWDYRGIAIPPLDTYIGIDSKFEQIVDTDKSHHTWKHYSAGLVKEDADMQVMELTKFVRLALQCNPSVIEILFAPEDCIIRCHPIMEQLLDVRKEFLSKQAKARFSGYALSQLNRIRRHKRFLDNPPTSPPKREDYGLPEYKLISLDQLGAAEALINYEVQQFVIDQNNLSEDTKIELENGLNRMLKTVWVQLHSEEYPIGKDKQYPEMEDVLYEGVAKTQFTENFLQILHKEKQYRSAKQQWDSYQTWIKTRNPKRAEIEKQHGFDRKNASHLVRLLRMAREILETGQVHVRRHDAEEIKAIRNGAWTYEELVEFAEKEDLALEEVVKKSNLPSKPNVSKIHNIVCEMVKKYND